jgi:desulfoferrodoxin (superoxide reductase-like protein)
MRRLMILCFLTMVMLVGLANGVWAGKSEASIQGPTEATKGEEVTLRITVSHSANTAGHYTEWVKVTANKKEVARWNYTKDQRPEGAVFTKVIEVKVTEDTEIVAEASCNLHGGKGPARHVIKVK